MIHRRMWDKAQSLVAADSLAAWREANVLPNGQRRKRHRPYVIPPRAHAMVDALGKGDVEIVASLIRDWDILVSP